MGDLIAGAVAMAYVVAGLFFMKFWYGTRDRLFLAFSVAFLILAAQRVALVLLALDADAAVWLYGLRLVAFVVIIAAILDKNSSSSR